MLKKRLCTILVLVWGLTLGGIAAKANLSDVELVIDDEVIIAPASAKLSAQNLVRAANGTIWINTGKTEPGLLRSADQGATWKTVSVNLPAVPPGQHLAGFYITRDGRFWLVHQLPPQVLDGKVVPDSDQRGFVSVSSDAGRSWQTSEIAAKGFAPSVRQDPYTSIEIAWCHPNFVEQTDGTVFFSLSMRYDDWDDFSQADQSRPGVRDVIVRTADGGRTWGDPTIVHQHATETAYVVDPQNPDHILAATRIQRKALPGEDLEAIRKRSAMDMTPPNYMPDWAYKNGLLLESTDGGRSFHEVPDGLFGFASYRWSAVWTDENWLILASNAGQDPGQKRNFGDQVVRISLNGGGRWLDGSAEGTSAPNKAKKFVVVPAYRDIGKMDHYSSGVPATVELSRNRFLTLASYKRDRILKGRVWNLENLP